MSIETSRFMESLRTGHVRLLPDGSLTDSSPAVRATETATPADAQVRLREAERLLRDTQGVFNRLMSSPAAARAAAARAIGISGTQLEAALESRTATEALNADEFRLFEASRSLMGDAAARQFAAGKPDRW